MAFTISKSSIIALILKIKIILPGLNIAEKQREEHGKDGRREVKQGEEDG